jgi:hypothetical protein
VVAAGRRWERVLRQVGRRRFGGGGSVEGPAAGSAGVVRITQAESARHYLQTA